MREKIKRRIDELWSKIEFEWKCFEDEYSHAKKYIEGKKKGEALVSVVFAIIHLRTIEDCLGDIELLERLLIDENEEKD